MKMMAKSRMSMLHKHASQRLRTAHAHNGGGSPGRGDNFVTSMPRRAVL